jgi:hypothetical protein
VVGAAKAPAIAAEQTDMVDNDALWLCSACMAGAATDATSQIDLQLTAVALARDLADTGWSGDAGLVLVDAAYGEAVSQLDSSDLDRGSFLAALRALSGLRARVRAALAQPVLKAA